MQENKGGIEHYLFGALKVYFLGKTVYITVHYN